MPDEFLKGRNRDDWKEACGDCQQEAQARLAVSGAAAGQVQRGGEASVICNWSTFGGPRGQILGRAIWMQELLVTHT